MIGGVIISILTMVSLAPIFMQSVRSDVGLGASGGALLWFLVFALIGFFVGGVIGAAAYNIWIYLKK